MKHSGVDQILSTVDVYLKRRQFIVSKMCFSYMICLFKIGTKFFIGLTHYKV